MTRAGFAGIVVFVALIVVAGVGLPIAVADTQLASDRSATITQPSTALDTQEFDSTTFRITVYENGTAVWTFRHEQRLTEDDREAFETFAEEFESEETDVYDRFRTQTQALTDTGSEATNREMEAHSFNRSAWVEDQLNPTGIVEMSFTWDGFAAVEDGSVVVGDVFRNLYLTGDQSIEIRSGDDLAFETVEPEPTRYDSTSLDRATTVTWDGEREFLDGQPRAVFTDPDTQGSSSAADSLWPLIVATLIVGLGAAVVWYRLSGRSAGLPSTDDAPTAETEATAEPAGEDTGVSDDLDDALLTDEDRVIALIRDNGGRMKQVKIVDETGWSKSKVSMLLSDMEEEGTISKLRVGRENIISLDGFEPEATKSPFEE